LNEQVAIPPQAFVAVQVTVLVPSGKELPEGGEQTIGPTLPVAVGVNQPRTDGSHVSSTRFVGQWIAGGEAYTLNGSTQVTLLPPQSEMIFVIRCVPGPTTVPAAGNWVMRMGPQLSEMQGELVNTERFGIRPTQLFVLSKPTLKSCRQPQFTTGGELSTTLTVWLQVFVLPHWSVRTHVRVAEKGQLLLVTVLRTETVTFVPLQASKPVGASNVQGVPQGIVLFAASWQMGETETFSK
jgi:hypothetical protein